MPATGNTITGSFGVDLSPLKRDFAEAKTIAKNGAAAVTAEMKKATATSGVGTGRVVPINWQNVGGRVSMSELERRYSPFRGNFGTNYRPAPPGKYPAPVDDLTDVTRRGFHSIRGLGVGLTVFSGAREIVGFYKAANEEAGKLLETVYKISGASSRQSFRGIAEIKSDLGEAASALEQIRKREFQESYGERFPRNQIATPLDAITAFVSHGTKRARQFVTGGSDEEDEALKKRIREGSSRAIDQMARSMGRLNEVERSSFEGSEKKAAILQEEAKWMENIADISKAELAAGINNPAARGEENKRHELANEQIERRFNLKKREADMEERILNLIGNGKTLEENRTEALRERVEVFKHAEVGLTGEGAQDARIKTRGAENELFQQEFDQRNAPGNALSTPETRKAQDFAYFIRHRSTMGARFGERHLGMNGEEIASPAYAKSPYAYDIAPQSGLMPTGGGAKGPGSKEGGSGADLLAEVKALRNDFQKIWGGN